MAVLVFGLCVFLTAALVVNSKCPQGSSMTVNDHSISILLITLCIKCYYYYFGRYISDVERRVYI